MNHILNLILGIIVGAGVTSGVLFIKSARRKKADFNKKWNELQEKK